MVHNPMAVAILKKELKAAGIPKFHSQYEDLSPNGNLINIYEEENKSMIQGSSEYPQDAEAVYSIANCLGPSSDRKQNLVPRKLPPVQLKSVKNVPTYGCDSALIDGVLQPIDSRSPHIMVPWQ